MFGAIVIFFFLPWIDRSKVRSAKFRPIYKQLFWMFFLVCVVLGYIGSQPPEGTMVTLGRVFSVAYFAFFPLLWLTSKFEKPKPLPQSIAAPVLKGASVGHAAQPMEKA